MSVNEFKSALKRREINRSLYGKCQHTEDAVRIHREEVLSAIHKGYLPLDGHQYMFDGEGNITEDNRNYLEIALMGYFRIGDDKERMNTDMKYISTDECLDDLQNILEKNNSAVGSVHTPLMSSSSGEYYSCDINDILKSNTEEVLLLISIYSQLATRMNSKRPIIVFHAPFTPQSIFKNGIEGLEEDISYNNFVRIVKSACDNDVVIVFENPPYIITERRGRHLHTTDSSYHKKYSSGVQGCDGDIVNCILWCTLFERILEEYLSDKLNTMMTNKYNYCGVLIDIAHLIEAYQILQCINKNNNAYTEAVTIKTYEPRNLIKNLKDDGLLKAIHFTLSDGVCAGLKTHGLTPFKEDKELVMYKDLATEKLDPVRYIEDIIGDIPIILEVAETKYPNSVNSVLTRRGILNRLTKKEEEID